MLKIKPEKVLAFLSLFTGFVFSLLNIFQYAGEPTLGADIVSRVLPAVGHRIGLGIPYVNYWEITPPGHYIVLDIWAQIFGFTGLSIKILHVLSCIGIIIFTYYVLSRVLNGVYLGITAVIIYFFLFSVRLTTFILPAEILALSFSLGGVSALFYFKKYKNALFIGSFLLFFSGQIKDPYLFSMLTLVPYILFLKLKSREDFLKGILFSLMGSLAALGLNIFYLLVMGSWDQYIEILKYKSTAFEVFDLEWLTNNFFVHLKFAKDVFFYFHLPILTPLIIYITVKILSKLKDKTLVIKQSGTINNRTLSGNFRWRIQKTGSWILSFYLIGLSIGFVIQRSLGSHYYIVAVVPLVTFIGLCFGNVDQEVKIFKKYRYYRLAVLLIFLSLILPKKDYFVNYSFGRMLELRFLPKLALWANENSLSPVVKRIAERTDKNDCIIDIYGWGVATTYLYSQRRPCSRFYITNLIAKEWQREEFRASILKDTPKAIIYNPTSGDLDYKRFEEIVTNFPKVLRNCYIKDTGFETLYFPKFGGTDLRQCIESSLY